MVGERGPEPLRKAIPLCWLGPCPGCHDYINPKPEKRKHLQRQLSETSADANFVNPVRHYLYSFLSVIYSRKAEP